MKTSAIREALLEFNDWVKTPAQGRLVAEAMEELNALNGTEEWNAAIEAAAVTLDARESATLDDDRRRAFGDAAQSVRALKREAK